MEVVEANITDTPLFVPSDIASRHRQVSRRRTPFSLKERPGTSQTLAGAAVRQASQEVLTAPGSKRRIGRCFLRDPLTKVLHGREMHPEAGKVPKTPGAATSVIRNLGRSHLDGRPLCSGAHPGRSGPV